MTLRKAIFPAFIALAVAAAAAFHAANKHIAAGGSDQAETHVFTPVIPDSPPLTIMDENSGQVYNIITRDPQSNLPTSIEVGFRDGRRGKYTFSGGKLRSYQGFDSALRLSFAAEYGENGLISSSRYLRADGSIETEYRRLTDGSEEYRFLDRAGKCLRSVCTSTDGTQTSTVFAADGKPGRQTVLKAELREQCFAPLSGAGQNWQYKVKLNGARVCSWEYRNKKGTLRHRGVFTADNKLEITLLNEQEQPVLKQIWIPVGEDWSRRFYRLSELQKLNPDESLSASITLYPDGVTPREISQYYDGRKNSTESCDSRGFMYHTEYFDTNGFPNGGWDVPAQSRRQSRIDPDLLAEPTDDGIKLYRLKGSPYTEALPQEAAPLCPLFM